MKSFYFPFLCALLLASCENMPAKAAPGTPQADIAPIADGKVRRGKPVALLDGEWQPDCNSPQTYFRVEEKTLILELIIDQAGVLDLKLEMVPDRENGEILLYYRGIRSFSWPLGTEEYAGYPLSEDDISPKVAVGKLIPESETRAELVWTGLYHMPFETVIYKDHLRSLENSNGRIVMNHCTGL